MREAPDSPYKRLVFREVFDSEQGVRSRGGVPTDVSISKGIGSFNGTTSKIVYPKVHALKSIRIRLTATNTTQDIIKLSDTHSISVSAGTISATGFSSPTIYVNGVASSTLTTNPSEIIITTATAIDATRNVIHTATNMSLEVKGIPEN